MTSRALLLEYVIRSVYWLMLAASIWILFRGHNAPGGGFIAGLVAVSATALLAIVYDVDSARRRLPLRPVQLGVTGILLAMCGGIAGFVSDQPFLTHLWAEIGFGGDKIKLSTVMLFDAGVYAAVWGSFTTYVFELMEG